MTAPKGAITAATFDQWNMWYGAKKWKDNWPFLSNRAAVPATADAQAWDTYFRIHLGGPSPVYKLFKSGKISFMNMPEERPETFDISYKADPALKRWLPSPTKEEEFAPGHRERMAAKFNQLLDDMRNGRLTRDSGEQGKAPAGTVFSNYDEAFRRHGRPRGRADRGGETS